VGTLLNDGGGRLPFFARAMHVDFRVTRGLMATMTAIHGEK
jgi:hypothetical protein